MLDKKEIIDVMKTFSRQDWFDVESAKEKTFEETDDEKSARINAWNENRKTYIESKSQLTIPSTATAEDIKRNIELWLDIHAESLKEFVGDVSLFKEKYIAEIEEMPGDKLENYRTGFIRLLNNYAK